MWKIADDQPRVTTDGQLTRGTAEEDGVDTIIATFALGRGW